MNAIAFYNEDGEAIAYLDNDGKHIWSFNGDALGYLDRDGVFNYDGKLVGWWDGGCLWDLNGDCAFFTEHASRGPVTPVRGVPPVRGVKEVKPVKGVKEVRSVRPVLSLSWSELNDTRYFE